MARTTASLVLAAVLLPSVAGAGPGPDGEPVFILDPAVEVPIIVLGSFTLVGLSLQPGLGRSQCAPLCDPDAVNRADRWSAGYYDEAWGTASDTILASTIGLGVLSAFVDGKAWGGLGDTLVIGESLLIAAAATTALKHAVRRSRPYLYDAATPIEIRRGDDGGLSFPSGHVALAAALSTSVFAISRLRHPGSALPWMMLGAGTILVGATAAGRILSGNHFLTDTLAGALVGAAAGLVVPALHRERGVRVLATVGSGEAGLAVFIEI